MKQNDTVCQKSDRHALVIIQAWHLAVSKAQVLALFFFYSKRKKEKKEKKTFL